VTPESWKLVKECFAEALELVPAERASFLARACEGDEDVRREVESLLAAHERHPGFMKKPVVSLTSGGGQSLATGQSFGQYAEVSLLGQRGTAEAYVAVDTRLRRQVALKLLPPAYTHDADRVRRFEREARAVSALNHPNILTIYEVGEEDGRHFIAAEYVEGETLRERLKRGRVEAGEAVEIAAQVASALAAAHEVGIVHRDVKPENVMLRPDGYIKLLDFGLAKLAGQPRALSSRVTTASKTQEGLVLGTVGYMSPEQARGEQVDARTDVWSLGVLLYEMLAGRAPFEGETPSHVMVSIMEHEPPPLPLDAEVPAGLGRLVERALIKETSGRYLTAGEMAHDLKGLREELPVESRLKRLRRSDADGEEAAAKSDVRPALKAARASATGTPGTAAARLTTSARYVIDGIRRHRGGAVFASTTALVLVASLVYFFNFAGRGGEAIGSVAVLPFVNAGGDPEAEYLSDGISESLINSLSQLPGLKVTARSSSFKYKGREVDPQEVARSLGVAAILTGRVSRRGEDLLISVELVDARDKTQVWGEQYNRKAADLIAVQSDISSEIARKLRLRLTAGVQQQLAKPETVNLQAYELLLKGRFTWGKGGTANRKTALEYYQQAIAVDPAYAHAYAELSGGYNSLITNNELEPKEFTPKAEAAARKALESDENLAEAHLAMAWVKLSAWDWAAAEREIKRAIELNPNLVGAHRTYAIYLRIHGKREEAVAQLNRVRELDPLSLSANQAVLVALSIFRQNEQALEVAQKILELDKSNPDAHTRVGQFYTRLGRYREAIAAYQEAIKLGDESPDAQILLGFAYAKAGEREKARAILQRFETGKEYCSPVGLAILHLGLGERDQAFASLEAAYAAHDQQLMWLRGEWVFDQLHSDPRFEALSRRIGLSP